jgi:hypothetical protein
MQRSARATSRSGSGSSSVQATPMLAESSMVVVFTFTGARRLSTIRSATAMTASGCAAPPQTTRSSSPPGQASHATCGTPSLASSPSRFDCETPTTAGKASPPVLPGENPLFMAVEFERIGAFPWRSRASLGRLTSSSFRPRRSRDIPPRGRQDRRALGRPAADPGGSRQQQHDVLTIWRVRTTLARSPELWSPCVCELIEQRCLGQQCWHDCNRPCACFGTGGLCHC